MLPFPAPVSTCPQTLSCLMQCLQSSVPGQAAALQRCVAGFVAWCGVLGQRLQAPNEPRALWYADHWHPPNTFTPSMHLLPLSWSQEMLTGISPRDAHCAPRSSVFVIFVTTILGNCFGLSSCCSPAQQRAPCFSTPFPDSWDAFPPQEVLGHGICTAEGITSHHTGCLESVPWFCCLS